jgi:hypothetical protein
LYFSEIDEDIIECHLSDRVIFDDVLQIFARLLEDTEHVMQRHSGRDTEMDHLVMFFSDTSFRNMFLNVANNILRVTLVARSNKNSVPITESAKRRERIVPVEEIVSSLLGFQVLNTAKTFEFTVDHNHQA